MTAHGLANGTYRIVDPVPPRRILSGLVSCVRVRVRVRVRVHVHVCVYMGVCVCVCVCVWCSWCPVRARREQDQSLIHRVSQMPCPLWEAGSWENRARDLHSLSKTFDLVSSGSESAIPIPIPSLLESWLLARQEPQEKRFIKARASHTCHSTEVMAGRRRHAPWRAPARVQRVFSKSARAARSKTRDGRSSGNDRTQAPETPPPPGCTCLSPRT